MYLTVLTKDQDVICNRNSKHRYWAINGQYYNSLYFDFSKEKWMIKKRS